MTIFFLLFQFLAFLRHKVLPVESDAEDLIKRYFVACRRVALMRGDADQGLLSPKAIIAV